MKYKSNRGITLIVLVVTIVVLLILASVSINTLFGNNGLITKAKEATKKYKESEKEDMESLKNLEIWFDEELSDTEEPRDPTLPEGSTIEAGEKAIGDNNTFLNVPVPKGFAVSGIYGENTLEDGLVIYDLSNAGKVDWKDVDYMQKTYNQYVWIEVPNNRTDGTGPNYVKAGVTKDAEPDKIKVAIKEYTEYTDSLYNDENPAFIDERNEMLKSVYRNAGFYIGRYEAGVRQNRIEQGPIDGIEVESKKDLYPCNWVTRDQAKILSNNLNKNGYKNTLMFGMQWDLVLQYLKKKGKVTDAEIRNSSNWGNYTNEVFPITSLNAQISTDKGITYKPISDEKTGEGILTTGAANTRSKQNIYDLAGNVLEWTLERYMDKNPCVSRGGNFSYSGSECSVLSRYDNSISRNNYVVGFRFSFYK